MNALSRFTRYTSQQEPVVTIGLLAAAILYFVDRYAHLTDDDLELYGLLLVPIVTTFLARFRAWSPASVRKALDGA
jgi:MFS superfamily sulfate permease-like transporter